MSSIVVGLTGQTGAGKSTISLYAEEMGCAVISADAVAREALAPGSDCLKVLAESFGYDIIDKDGSCRRSLLAERAFADREKTDLLNSITHPWIISRAGEYISLYMNKNYDVILFDASQLFESGGQTLCDFVIAVTAPEDIRMERIIRRDGISREAALLRIKAQYGEEFYTSRADYVIDGSASVDEVRAQMKKILCRSIGQG